jgi:transposase-like protein
MKQFSNSEKNKHIRKWQQSGISCIEYCRKNNLHPNTLYRWKKTFDRESEAIKSSFVEIPASLETIDNGPEIRIETTLATVHIPVALSDEQFGLIFSLLGITHVS